MPSNKRSTRNSSKILKEFNHLCAICGNPRPQVHHIDGDNSNNNEDNLLPLCPNHHLLDAHSPTSPIDSLCLGLFRKYKDPIILSPQFQPLFKRILFLLSKPISDDKVFQKVEDLCLFVEHLNMGKYYSEKIRSISGLKENSTTNATRTTSNPDQANALRRIHEELRRAENNRRHLIEKIDANSDLIIELSVELLRYQHWSSGKSNFVS